jgi:hypothetical protein
MPKWSRPATFGTLRHHPRLETGHEIDLPYRGCHRVDLVVGARAGRRRRCRPRPIETSKRFFRPIVLEYWHLSEGVLKKSRAEQNNARLYKEFEDLYQRWKN